MSSSFYDTQMFGLAHRIIALLRSGANCREIEIRKIRGGALGSVRFPLDLVLAAAHGARQTRSQKAVVVVGIDPGRALRGIVAVIGRGTPDGSHFRGAGPTDGTRQQHDADIGRLPVDRGT